MVKTINFKLYIFYHNKNFLKTYDRKQIIGCLRPGSHRLTTFWRDRNVLYIDCVGGYCIELYIIAKTETEHLKWVNFIGW